MWYMWRIRKPIFNLLDAKDSTGNSNTVDVKNFRNAVLSIGTANSGNLTVKVQWALAKDDSDIDFTSAQGATNQWDYIEIVDLQNGTAIDWDTWFSVSGTDDTRIFELNINGLDYISLDVTDYTAWDVTANLVLYTDE